MRYLIIFVLIFIFLMGAGCERPSRSDTPPAGTAPQIPAESLIPAEVYTLDEVAEHALPDDCWIVIDGVVYDVTEFPSEHTGGAEAVIQWCGQDASHGFNTKNGSNGSHSVKSKLFLDKYFKGNLSQ